MAIPRFPLDPDQIVGRFWVTATEADAHSDGVCRVTGDAIEIDVITPLTPWMEQVGDDNSFELRRIQERDDLVVHGALPINPQAVTFFGARTATRHSTWMPGSSDVPELHRMRADWCIAGAHVDSADTKFAGVRARFTHLELWARSPSLEVNHQVKPSWKSTVVYTPAEATEAAFQQFEESAILRLSSGAALRTPNVWGYQVQTHDWLELSGLSGWTLEESLARFVRPVQVLLTLLAGEQCDVTHLEVWYDDQWCAVYGGAVDRDAPLPVDTKVLLGQDTMTLETLGTWCGVAVRLSPAPHVVASSVSGAFVTMESDALALTTTAEGMDRVLYPDSRRFSEAEIGASIEAVQNSTAPANVREAMVNALRLHFFEDSYPTRIQRLAAVVAEAVPSCVGKANIWKREVANLRIALAHVLDQEPASTDDTLMEMHTLTLSLRWALTMRMLLEAGVETGILAAAAKSSERYRRDERTWRRHLPKIFAKS